MIFDSTDLAPAILFFGDDGGIHKQMNMAEFDAVLDGYVGMQDIAGRCVKAAYVDINQDLIIKRVVFFILPVCIDGTISRDWSIPLLDLAIKGAEAKVPSGETILLTCRSRCTEQRYRDVLWDPNLQSKQNQLTQMQALVSGNRLGLQFVELEGDNTASSELAVNKAKLEQEITQRLRKDYADELRENMAQFMRSQQDQFTSVRSEQSQGLALVKQEYEIRMEALRNQALLKDEQIERLRLDSSALKEVSESQERKTHSLRDYYEQKLERLRDLETDSADITRQTTELELKHKFDEDTRSLRESLQTKEVELLYRQEAESKLQAEVSRLRAELRDLEPSSGGGDELLTKLVQSGVTLVSFQPGAGHLSIPLSDVPLFVDSPTRYTAERCNVSEEHYTQWLNHYHMPVCQQQNEKGSVCCENIDRIDIPADFKLGESDRCPECYKKKTRAHLRLAGS